MRYGVWKPIPQRVWDSGDGEWVPKWGPRSGTPIQAVVIHRIEGRLEGADSWLRNPDSGAASTHFGIGFPNWYSRLIRRNVQTWQWVDTIYAAYGWSNTPTDRPTSVAHKVLGRYLVRQAKWPYYRSTIDLNRPVIAIEVEGQADKPFDPLFIPPLKGLLNAIARAHGPLWVMVHTDCSSKPCPGLSYFMAAMPGYYGERLTAQLPDTSSGGLPVRYRPIRKNGTIHKGSNFREGPGTNFPIHYTAPEDMVRFIDGEVPGQSYNGSTRWMTFWSQNSDTADNYDGQWVYVHRSVMTF